MNRIVVWHVWPPRTTKCSSYNMFSMGGDACSRGRRATDCDATICRDNVHGLSTPLDAVEVGEGEPGGKGHGHHPRKLVY